AADGLADVVAVRRSPAQRLQDQHVEGALEQVGARRAAVGHGCRQSTATGCRLSTPAVGGCGVGSLRRAYADGVRDAAITGRVAYSKNGWMIAAACAVVVARLE